MISIESASSARALTSLAAKAVAEKQGSHAYFECDAKSGIWINQALEASFELALARAGFWEWACLPYSSSIALSEGVLNAGPQAELSSPDFAATRGSRFNFSLPSASEEASLQKNSNNHFM